MSKLTAMEWLALCNPRVSDAGISTLVNLKELSVHYMYYDAEEAKEQTITNAGISFLTNLTRLTLSSNEAITHGISTLVNLTGHERALRSRFCCFYHRSRPLDVDQPYHSRVKSQQVDYELCVG